MFGFDAARWREFARSHWEQRPTVIRAPFGRPLATADAMVAALARLRVRTWRNGSPQRNLLRFFVEKGQILCDAERFFPDERTTGFLPYVERVTDQLDGQRFGISGNAMQAGDPQLARDLRGFLRGLFDEVGMPVEDAEAVCFAGNYELSPFGIHTDTAGVFSFVIAGHKRYRVWPFEALKDAPALRYGSIGWERHRDSSVLLEGEPGDLIYWPSTYWHVGLAEPGELSMVINVPMYLSAHPWDFVKRAVARVTRSRTRGGPLLTFARGDGYPAVLGDAIRELGEIHATEFAREARRQWLEMVTSVALPSYDERLARPALDDASVIAIDDEPIVHERHGTELVVAFRGDSIVVPASAGAERVLGTLRAGRASVGALVQGDPAARAVLEELATIGAVRVAP